MSKVIILSAVLALCEARFSQEGLVQNKIQALSNFGNPGQAATLAGQTPGVLLAGANACAKLTLADTIVSSLGNDPAVIAGAAALVAAEKNFNPFAQSVPTICDDPTLPVTEALRGIVPLVDPAVTGSDVENAISATSLTTPFDATGLSVAQVMAANGFSNFTTQAADGTAGAAPAAGNGSGAAAGGAANTAAADCGAATITKTVAASAAAATTAEAAAAASGAAGSGATVEGAAAGTKSSIAGLDFGQCVPTISFEFGRPGRKATEGTFLPSDPLVAKGQQDALNPEIIMNRVCDQLINVCAANDAAHSACEAAKAALGGGARDATTADAWNKQLGF